jgi:hypothetical protein
MPGPLLAPFDLVAGHILTRVRDRRVLLDTGSPATFGRCDRLRLLGDEQPVSPGILGFTVDAVVEHIRQLPGVSPQFDFDLLLGTDLLWGHRIVLDFAARLLRMDPAAGLASRPPGAVRNRFIVEDLLVWGAPVRAVIDTGAPVSYLATSLSGGFRPAGRARDFFHGEGDFEVPLRRGRAVFRGREVEVSFAEPPASVAMAMRLLGVDAIVGTDLLEQMGVVVLELC